MPRGERRSRRRAVKQRHPAEHADGETATERQDRTGWCAPTERKNIVLLFTDVPVDGRTTKSLFSRLRMEFSEPKVAI